MFERGEANIDYQTSSAFLSKVTPLVKAGKAVPIMSWGSLDASGNIVRDPTLPQPADLQGGLYAGEGQGAFG